MAEMQSQQLQQKNKGVKRSKKLSTRVDLTPMVDLGFLLITFFVFTTSLSKPKVMALNLPQDKNIKDSSVSQESKTLSLILKDDKTVGYYYGTDMQHMQFTNYATGLRNVIIKKQQEVTRRYGKPDDLMVLIKPTDKATYGKVVETLDEMLITNVKIYMLLEATVQEAAIAQK
ncbi:MAG TPA: biopolymer transporter ExbD [Chitinophagaceae bacterium]|nr:biopolymer transporter ExbD [Chitinophagaceae bacterium]